MQQLCTSQRGGLVAPRCQRSTCRPPLPLAPALQGPHELAARPLQLAGSARGLDARRHRREHASVGPGARQRAYSEAALASRQAGAGSLPACHHRHVCWQAEVQPLLLPSARCDVQLPFTLQPGCKALLPHRVGPPHQTEPPALTLTCPGCRAWPTGCPSGMCARWCRRSARLKVSAGSSMWPAGAGTSYLVSIPASCAGADFLLTACVCSSTAAVSAAMPQCK